MSSSNCSWLLISLICLSRLVILLKSIECCCIGLRKKLVLLWCCVCMLAQCFSRFWRDCWVLKLTPKLTFLFYSATPPPGMYANLESCAVTLCFSNSCWSFSRLCCFANCTSLVSFRLDAGLATLRVTSINETLCWCCLLPIAKRSLSYFSRKLRAKVAMSSPNKLRCGCSIFDCDLILAGLGNIFVDAGCLASFSFVAADRYVWNLVQPVSAV